MNQHLIKSLHSPRVIIGKLSFPTRGSQWAWWGAQIKWQWLKRTKPQNYFRQRRHSQRLRKSQILAAVADASTTKATWKQKAKNGAHRRRSSRAQPPHSPTQIEWNYPKGLGVALLDMWPCRKKSVMRFSKIKPGPLLSCSSCTWRSTSLAPSPPVCRQDSHYAD